MTTTEVVGHLTQLDIIAHKVRQSTSTLITLISGFTTTDRMQTLVEAIAADAELAMLLGIRVGALGEPAIRIDGIVELLVGLNATIAKPGQGKAKHAASELSNSMVARDGDKDAVTVTVDTNGHEAMVSVPDKVTADASDKSAKVRFIGFSERR